MKQLFPIFSNVQNLVYLDSASTTQKPQSVIDSMVKFYTEYNSNIHRALYPLSIKASEQYEKAREVIAQFINAKPNEIIFTSGTTESVNGIIRSLKISNLLNENSKIAVSEFEHNSNLIPWINDFKNPPEYINDLKSDYDLIALTHGSNVTGEILDIKSILKKQKKTFSLVDASQSISHLPIDVKDMDIDFLVFSGHKIYGPTGIGVLYIREDLIKKLKPWKYGGGMVESVNLNSFKEIDNSQKFEAGTPNIAGAIGLSEAIRFVNSIGFNKIIEIESKLTQYLYNEMYKITKLSIFKSSELENQLPVLSFSHNIIHPHDIADFLGENNICVRSGYHCSHILHKNKFSNKPTTRVSLGVYNDKSDVDAFINQLKKAIEVYSN